MKERWIAGALSLVTVVGGHFYNRRPYKGVLFLVIMVMFPWVLPSLTSTLWETSGTDPWMIIRVSALVSLIFYALLTLCSVIVTIHDADKRGISESSTLRITSIVLGSLMGMVYLGWIGFQQAAVMTTSELQGFSKSSDDTTGFQSYPRGKENRQFCLSQGCFGTAASGSIPAGDAYIQGEVRVEGEPLQDAKLELLTRDGQVSESATTDENGEFRFSLPAGSYDFIQVNVNAEFPDGGWRYSGATGRETRLEKVPEISGHSYLPDQPLRVDVEPGDVEPLNVYFRKSPELRQPRFAGKGDVSPSDMTLEWTPVDGAETYGVVISRIKQKGDGVTSHYPVQRLTSETTSVSLESVVVPAGPDEEVPGYSISILAFDAERRFIAENIGSGDRIEMPDGWKIHYECERSMRCQ